MSENKKKYVMLHGMDKKELSAIVDLIKKNVADPHNYIFASTTPTVLTFTVENWINELANEQKQVREMIRNYVKTQKQNSDDK